MTSVATSDDRWHQEREQRILDLTSELEDAREQLALRSPSNVERDMQIVMKNNNDLLTARATKDKLLVEAREALEPFVDARGVAMLKAISIEMGRYAHHKDILPTLEHIKLIFANAHITLANLKAEMEGN